jgi:hypothetical protein
MQLAVVGFASLAAVLLLVLVMGPPSRPNLFSILLVAAIAGLAFWVTASQVADYKLARPSRELLSPSSTAVSAYPVEGPRNPYNGLLLNH